LHSLTVTGKTAWEGSTEQADSRARWSHFAPDQSLSVIILKWPPK